jgi:hypothetical protein
MENFSDDEDNNIEAHLIVEDTFEDAEENTINISDIPSKDDSLVVIKETQDSLENPEPHDRIETQCGLVIFESTDEELEDTK